MGCFPTSNVCLSFMCETRSQIKHIKITTSFVLHQFNNRKMKPLTIDFT